MEFDAELSDLIGLIYECALDHKLWHATLGQICERMEAHIADLSVFDAASGQILLSVPYNWSDDLLALVHQHAH